VKGRSLATKGLLDDGAMTDVVDGIVGPDPIQGRHAVMREAFGYANLEWKRGIDWDAVRAVPPGTREGSDATARPRRDAAHDDENVPYVTSTLTPGGTG
jgi:hypothetical protein